MVVIKNEKNVGVGKAAFLKLNDVNEGLDFSEDISFVQSVEEGVQFQMEDSTDYMRCILWFLARVERLLDLLPLWVAGERDKEIGLTEMSTDCHRILVLLSHMHPPMNEEARMTW